jgi:hypothetical protein
MDVMDLLAVQTGFDEKTPVNPLQQDRGREALSAFAPRIM